MQSWADGFDSLKVRLCLCNACKLSRLRWQRYDKESFLASLKIDFVPLVVEFIHSTLKTSWRVLYFFCSNGVCAPCGRSVFSVAPHALSGRNGSGCYVGVESGFPSSLSQRSISCRAKLMRPGKSGSSLRVNHPPYANSSSCSRSSPSS